MTNVYQYVKDRYYILQTDPSYSHPQMRKLFKLYDEIDQIPGLKNKRAYMAKHKQPVK